ncbi:MAG TPA: hypothetical protein VGC45_08130 [Gryllotalpicola sp.]
MTAMDARSVMVMGAHVGKAVFRPVPMGERGRVVTGSRDRVPTAASGRVLAEALQTEGSLRVVTGSLGRGATASPRRGARADINRVVTVTGVRNATAATVPRKAETARAVPTVVIVRAVTVIVRVAMATRVRVGTGSSSRAVMGSSRRVAMAAATVAVPAAAARAGMTNNGCGRVMASPPVGTGAHRASSARS